MPYSPQARIYFNVLNRNISLSKSSGHKNELMRSLHQEHQINAYYDLMSVCLFFFR